MEAGEYDDVMGEWLGVPMFISSFDPDTMKGLVEEAGFELLETAIEEQVEGGQASRRMNSRLRQKTRWKRVGL